jgi:Domain of unknown function (DUF4209)
MSSCQVISESMSQEVSYHEESNSVPPEALFPFCHSDIAKILAGPMERQTIIWPDKIPERVDDASLQAALQAFATDIDPSATRKTSVQDSIDLAVICDRAVFSPAESGDCVGLNSTKLQAFLASLVMQVQTTSAKQQQEDAESIVVTVATLLALNVLESTIQQATATVTTALGGQRKSAGAPLLKDMLQQLRRTKMVPSCLANICSLLLLPHDGLNFRNLVWHGFVANVPRPWFSLVVILIQELQSSITSRNIKEDTTIAALALQNISIESEMIDLRTYPQFERILTHHDKIINAARTNQILTWVERTTSSSSSHVALCRLALNWLRQPSTMPSRPATVGALLSVVLEHCLRLEWCRANGRPQDKVARPGTFYVTLDGHGQRHVHDMILHPYILNGEDGAMEWPTQQNKLVWHGLNCHSLSSSAVALLMDLYCSPFGPNIRSAAAHGLWNVYFAEEWIDIPETASTRIKDQQKLADMASMIYYAMAQVPSEPLDNDNEIKFGGAYQPAFTYSPRTRKGVRRASEAWGKLGSFDVRGLLDEPDIPLSQTIVTRQQDLFSEFDPSTVESSLETKGLRDYQHMRVEEEYELNRRLAPIGATRNLLEAAADALQVHHRRIFMAREVLNDSDGSTSSVSNAVKRKQKTARRLIGVHESILSFYRFVYWVALSSLESGISEEKIRRHSITPELVRRTSMALSTVDTFVDSNLDRSVRAIAEFASSKVLKELLRSKE